MHKIKKGDIVQVTKGKDAGKKGKVLEFNCTTARALVEGINMVKKAKRKTQQDQQGGITSIEAPISIANIMPVCNKCDKPVRVGFSQLKDGTKARICKSCKEAM